MRLLLQRVSQARVDIDGPDGRQAVGQIGQGLLVLAGFGRQDGPELPAARVWRTMCEKLLDLRIFPDAEGRMNLSLRETAAAGRDAGQAAGLLLVSQFTLYADTRRGRRPSFTEAAAPELARSLYHKLVADLGADCAAAGLHFATGRFGAEMHLAFTNWGPVTILLDSRDYESAGERPPT